MKFLFILMLAVFGTVGNSYVYGRGCDSLNVVDSVICDTAVSISCYSDYSELPVSNDYAFKPKQLILPASLIAVGAFGVCNGWANQVKDDVKDGMADMRKDCYFHADDYIQYLPVAAHLGLGKLGVKAKHSFGERIAVAATSYIVMTALVNGIKYSVREKRPDSSARNSFPSGHTATAFTGAELVRIEYGNAYGAGAYAVACGVAFLRLYNERHWLNDVIAGAGIGILSARIGYWLLPLNRKIFKIKGKNAPTIVSAPFYDYTSKGLGYSMAIAF